MTQENAALPHVPGFLTETVREDPRTAAGRPVSPDPEQADAKRPVRDPKEIEALLKRLLANKATVTSGALHFINLHKLRDRFGKRWPRLALKVYGITESVLSKTLSERDFFTRFDEGTYIVVFGTLTKDQASAKCGAVGYEILRRLMGDTADFEGVEVRVAVAKVDGGIALKKIPLIEAVAGALQEAPSEPVDGNPAGGGTSPPPSVRHGAPPAARMAGLLTDTAARLRAMRNRSQDGPARHGGKGSGADLRVRVDETADIETEQSGWGVSYRPVWQVRKGIVSGNLARPYRRDAGQVLTGGRLLPPAADSSDLAALDMYVLERSLTDLCRMLAAGHYNVLIVPVHYATVSGSRYRTPYFDLCDALPDDLRRFLIWEVLHTEKNSWHSSLLGNVALLKPFGRSLLFRVGAGDQNIEDLKMAGVHAVGVHLRDLGWSSKETLRKFEEFAGRADKAKLHSYALGVHAVWQATTANCAGLHYLSGDAIAATIRQPKDVLRLGMEEFYVRA